MNRHRPRTDLTRNGIPWEERYARMRDSNRTALRRAILATLTKAGEPQHLGTFPYAIKTMHGWDGGQHGPSGILVDAVCRKLEQEGVVRIYIDTALTNNPVMIDLTSPDAWTVRRRDVMNAAKLAAATFGTGRLPEGFRAAVGEALCRVIHEHGGKVT